MSDPQSHPNVTNPTATAHGVNNYLPLPREQRKGTALCLSGGGYRASLFDLGAMRRLNELGILSQVDTVSSVSGGSIAAAFVAAHVTGRLSGKWPEPEDEVPGFDDGIARPLRELAAQNIRTSAALTRINPLNIRNPNAASNALAGRYAEEITTLTIAELPERPRFVFCATDLRFRTQWVIDGGPKRHGSEVVGYQQPIPGDWTVARAVAASSCFPGVFPPMRLELNAGDFKGGSYQDFDRVELCRQLDITDGGVYDNLGLEPVWQDHAVVLVSDGSPSFGPTPDLGPVWPSIRPIVTLLEQATVVRKRWLMANFLNEALDGAYWGIASLPSNYDPPADVQVYPDDLITRVISQVRIELDAFSKPEMAVLENHGYLMCDLAVRQHEPHLIHNLDAPLQPPYPDWMDPQKTARALARSHTHKLLGRGRWW
ncbi:patatin-like phospholipase family protein [soil metagenome]